MKSFFSLLPFFSEYQLLKNKVSKKNEEIAALTKKVLIRNQTIAEQTKIIDELRAELREFCVVELDKRFGSGHK